MVAGLGVPIFRVFKVINLAKSELSMSSLFTSINDKTITQTKP